MPAIAIGKTTIPYELRRSRTARQRRVTVTPDRVEVLAPVSDSDADVEDFLHRKRKWIFDSVRELEVLVSQRPNVPRLMSGSKIPFRGRSAKITIRRTDAEAVEVSFRRGFLVDLPSWVSRANADAVVASELRLWLKDNVRREVRDLAKQYTTRFGINPRAVRTVELKNGWGSCGRGGTIHINWTLVFAPKRVLEYAVVHELAHLKVRSHGEKFWAFVELMMPNYQTSKDWLDAHQGEIDASFLSR